MRRTYLALPVLLVLAQTATGQTPSTEKPESIYDRIWKFSEVYDDSSNPVVQRVLFTGRLHQDFSMLDADQGEHNEANLRRLRLGPRITLFNKLQLHAEVELNPQERDPTYVRFTDFYGQWTQNPQVVVTVGKHAVPFTLEGATSSRELLTIDRSNLANNIWFPQEYLPGVSLSGRRGAWNYRGGVYSGGEMNREFGEFDGAPVVLGVLGYDLAKRLGVRQALLSGNYVYQREDQDNTFTRQLDHVMSINFKYDRGPWGTWTDLAVASGYLGQSDLWAFVGQPFVNATSRLQFVGRYTYMSSEDVNGIRLATYESRVVSGRGNEYNELYFGANYFFYGHRLKLQSGVQWADMNDSAGDGGEYSGVAWTTGIRIGW